MLPNQAKLPSIVNDWQNYTRTINENPFNVPAPKSNTHNSNDYVSNFKQGPSNQQGFKPAKAVLEEYKLTLSKELCTKLHVQMLESQLQYRLYPNWSVTYKPPISTINSLDKVNKLVETRETLARIMLETNKEFYTQLQSELEDINKSSVESLEAMHATGGGKRFNLKEALEEVRISANDTREKKLAELTKIMEAINQAPIAALWQGIPEEYERPTGAVRVRPPPRVDAGPPRQPRRNKNNQGNDNRARAPSRPPANQPRNRSVSAKPNFNKRRRDEITRYVAKAVQNTVRDMVSDFM